MITGAGNTVGSSGVLPTDGDTHSRRANEFQQGDRRTEVRGGNGLVDQEAIENVRCVGFSVRFPSHGGGRSDLPRGRGAPPS